MRVGYPFGEIVQMANHFDVDLIIIGSHGYTGITRLLVGSTAERVVARALYSVLVVKERPLKTENLIAALFARRSDDETRLTISPA